MTPRNSPPPMGWVTAPLGKWLKNRRGRTLAHIWPGADETWRGYAFNQEYEICHEFGPVVTEALARGLAEEYFTPKEEKTA